MILWISHGFHGAVLAVGEESREMAELQKAFFILLHAICANELTGVVIAMDSSLLDLLLQALLATASSHSEAAIRRACFQVISAHDPHHDWSPIGTSCFPFQKATVEISKF